MKNTYRSAGWIADDHQADVRLTTDADKDLSDDALLDLAIENAREICLDMRTGEIMIGDWEE